MLPMVKLQFLPTDLDIIIIEVIKGEIIKEGSTTTTAQAHIMI